MIFSHSPVDDGKREYRYDPKLEALVLFVEGFPDDIIWVIAKLGTTDINGNVLTKEIAIKTAEEWNKDLREKEVDDAATKEVSHRSGDGRASGSGAIEETPGTLGSGVCENVPISTRLRNSFLRLVRLCTGRG